MIRADDGAELYLQALYEDWARREEDPVKRGQLPASFRSEAAHIAAPLEYVRTFGGIDAYILHSGVPADALSALRSLLLDPVRTSRPLELAL